MSSPLTTLTGVLVDVSGSMRASVDAAAPVEEVAPWVRSIFKVIDNLIKHDLNSDNHRVFAIGFGASGPIEVFDVLNSVDRLRTDRYEGYDLKEIANRILDILMDNGALHIRDCVNDPGVAAKAVPRDDAVMLLARLEDDRRFARLAVAECLPEECRVGLQDRDQSSSCGGSCDGRVGHAVGHLLKADEKAVREAYEKAMKIPLKLATVNDSSVFDAKKASSILRGTVGREEITESRIRDLTRIVGPHIYGGTPLFRSLNEAKTLFSLPQYREYKKLLFVLSDGEPADRENSAIQTLRNENVTVVGCFITPEQRLEPLRLFSKAEPDWGRAPKFMFQLSSSIQSQYLPRTIFVKSTRGKGTVNARRWIVDTDNNETRLFVQVNHPDNIDDVCDLARDVVCCQDALSDVLSWVSLDLYISQQNKDARPPTRKQTGGTCYAYAAAAALHLAMKRILGREGGYPEYTEIRSELIDTYGKEGASTLDVLREVCPKYRLHCRQVDLEEALRVIAEKKRPVIATYRLTVDEWRMYVSFFDHKSTGILNEAQVDVTQRVYGGETIGHAVVLTSFNSKYMRFMDSWGTDWANNGFIRVKNGRLLGMKFYDVYWSDEDLRPGEKAYYKANGPRVAAELLSKLKGLHESTYTCPLCKRESLVSEFAGMLVRATCPKCRREFESTGEGNVLALYMYLTSIADN